MTLNLMSPAFTDGAGIPEKYSRDGDNRMPPLKWSGAPDGTRSFALVVEDPDAPNGMFLHLAAYNIPPDATELGQASDGEADEAIDFARNDFGNERYDGPEPPRGDKPHHYHFRLAALDVPHLSIPHNAGVAAVWTDAQRHMIEEADLIGTYRR